MLRPRSAGNQQERNQPCRAAQHRNRGVDILEVSHEPLLWPSHKYRGQQAHTVSLTRGALALGSIHESTYSTAPCFQFLPLPPLRRLAASVHMLEKGHERRHLLCRSAEFSQGTAGGHRRRGGPKSGCAGAGRPASLGDAGGHSPLHRLPGLHGQLLHGKRSARRQFPHHRFHLRGRAASRGQEGDWHLHAAAPLQPLLEPALCPRAIAPSRHNSEQLGAERVGGGCEHPLGLDAALA